MLHLGPRSVPQQYRMNCIISKQLPFSERSYQKCKHNVAEEVIIPDQPSQTHSIIAFIFLSRCFTSSLPSSSHIFQHILCLIIKFSSDGFHLWIRSWWRFIYSRGLPLTFILLVMHHGLWTPPCKACLVGCVLLPECNNSYFYTLITFWGSQ